MSDALRDLTYILYFLARHSAVCATSRCAYVLVDRRWMALYCRACCAAFGFPSRILLVGTRQAVEEVAATLATHEAATIVASKIVYLKYSSVLQSLKERGALIVA